MDHADFKVNLKNELNIEQMLRELCELRDEVRDRRRDRPDEATRWKDAPRRHEGFLRLVREGSVSASSSTGQRLNHGKHGERGEEQGNQQLFFVFFVDLRVLRVGRP